MSHYRHRPWRPDSNKRASGKTGAVQVPEKRGLPDWRRDYNVSRPHTSLGDRTPREFARCHLL
ncbi:integrase core domain-containing protein [Desulfoferula mesophila]|uniref:integrase core domain-containing protein n=1 Tax=Desulfoferula mesophila TaxID=3058419 RepID=UPI003312FD66